MAAHKMITVEVAYARPELQRIISIEVEEGISIETAIDRSGILEIFPEIDLTKQKVGIFSQLKKLTDKVHAGDRVEIYRSLLIDPKEARRRRATASHPERSEGSPHEKEILRRKKHSSR